MNGALIGFRIGGLIKLMRLHGDRSCEQILRDLVAWLRSAQAGEPCSCGHAWRAINLRYGFSSPARSRMPADPARQSDPGVVPRQRSCSDVFAVLAHLETWQTRWPASAEGPIETCSDVSWGFLVNFDSGTLQVYINRLARFDWCDLAAQAPFCSIPISAAARLSGEDIATLHEILLPHYLSDGLDPVLLARDGLSAPLPGRCGWTWRLQVSNNRFRLVLARGDAEVEVAMLGELRFNDPACGAFLRSVVHPKVLRLGYAICGPTLSLSEAARVAACIDDLPFHPGASGLPLLELGLQSSGGIPLHPGSSYFDRLRGSMLSAGMSSQGWRFLIRQSGPVLRCLLAFFRPSAQRLRDFTEYINLLASAMQSEPLRPERCELALRGVQRILERGPRKANDIRKENARIYLRALMRAALSAVQEINLAHEAQDVADFVHARQSAMSAKHATWQSLCRRSLSWHREVWIRMSADRDVHWDSLLPSYDAGTYKAIELHTGAGLAEEGLEQKHCVARYVGACASGSCRIFSLRCDGKRMATVELRREPDGKWRIGQVRGKANQVIEDQILLGVAGQLAQAYGTVAQQKATLMAGQP